MKIKEVKLYQFNELSDNAKENAVAKLYDINVDHEWWEQVYDDAKEAGLKINEFDIGRGSYCKGEFMASAKETAHKITENHGKTCETRQAAEAYLKERDEIIDTADKDENGYFADECGLDEKLDELTKEFLKSICEDYRIILSKEYDYLTSEEAIIETIEANEYWFDVNGNLE